MYVGAVRRGSPCSARPPRRSGTTGSRSAARPSPSTSRRRRSASAPAGRPSRRAARPCSTARPTPCCATAVGVAALKTARVAECDFACTIATSGWPRSAAADLVRVAGRAADRRARAALHVAARPLDAEPVGFGASGRGRRAPCRRAPSRPRRTAASSAASTAGLPRDRPDEARVRGRRPVRVGRANREAERVPDVARADQAAPLGHAAQQRAARAHRVAAVPLVRVGDRSRRRSTSRARRPDGRPASAARPPPAATETVGPRGRGRRRGEQSRGHDAPQTSARRREREETRRALRSRTACVRDRGACLEARRLVPWAALLASVVALAVPSSASPSKGLVARSLRRRGDARARRTTRSRLLETLNVQVAAHDADVGRPRAASRRDGPLTRPTRPIPPTTGRATTSAIEHANDAGIQVLLTIVGTPAWANGGLGPERPPSSATTLRQFAYAAARRYSGTFLDTATGRVLPRVGMWLAWNEPNNPVFLQPQFVRVKGSGGRPPPRPTRGSATRSTTACTPPAGPSRSRAARPRRAARTTPPSDAAVDLADRVPARGQEERACAASTPGRTTRTTAARAARPPRRNVGPRAVELGNIDSLIGQVTQLYGRKPLWITEYGYQTKPPTSSSA